MSLTSYRFGTGAADHLFCRNCGVKSFYQPRSHPDAWSVNANCLDEHGRADRWRVRRRELGAGDQGPSGRSGSRVAATAISTRTTSAVRRADAPPAPPDHRSLRASGELALACRSAPGCRRARRSRPTAMGSARARRSQALHRGGLPRLFRVDLGRGGRAWRRCRTAPSLIVLHGVGPDDVEAALATRRGRCLNTAEQVARWKEIAPGRAVRRDDRHRHQPARAAADEIDALDGLTIETLHSHLACADEDMPLNAMQLERFRAVAAAVPAKRYSLANSRRHLPWAATIASTSSGPGLALYGGVPRAEAEGNIRQVARVEAQIVQRRTIRAGETCGYGATFTAERGHRGGDPQHRLCRRLFARLLVARVGLRRRICAAGARAGVDGPDRGRLRRRARASRKATGSRSTTTCRRLRSSPAFRSTSC